MVNFLAGLLLFGLGILALKLLRKLHDNADLYDDIELVIIFLFGAVIVSVPFGYGVGLVVTVFGLSPYDYIQYIALAAVVIAGVGLYKRNWNIGFLKRRWKLF